MSVVPHPSQPTGTTPAPVPLDALNERLKAIIETKTKDKPVMVRATVTDVTRTRSGHVHFRLRDGKYGLGCVVFRSVARNLPFWIKDGQTLCVFGEVKIDPGWGELQIVARQITLDETATSETEFNALKARAEAVGWLNPNRKRSLPHPLSVLGLITGVNSKARVDVAGSLKDAGLKVRLVFEPALMHGSEVTEEITSALSALNDKPDVEAVLITRGGGSRSDLRAFNEWDLAAAIVSARTPVITAIGHRQDQTLADLVADLSVPTPSSIGPALASGRPTDAVGRPPDKPARRAVLVAVAFLLAVTILLVLLASILGSP